MIAQLGLSNVWLESGNVSRARFEAGAFLESALSTADPYLQALAWEVKSRIAIAEGNWKQAHDYVHEGLLIVGKFDVPVAAWQVHARAQELYLQAGDEQAAERHRARAEAHILTIA